MSYSQDSIYVSEMKFGLKFVLKAYLYPTAGMVQTDELSLLECKFMFLSYSKPPINVPTGCKFSEPFNRVS